LQVKKKGEAFENMATTQKKKNPLGFASWGGTERTLSPTQQAQQGECLKKEQTVEKEVEQKRGEN